MNIQAISMSKLYKQCKLPNVSRDILNHPLDMGNVDDTFIKDLPVLITNYNKGFKGCKTLIDYLNWPLVDKYLNQFKEGGGAGFPFQEYVEKAYGVFQTIIK